MVKNLLPLILVTATVCTATSRILDTETTATQSILRLETDQSGACTVQVSLVNNFSSGYIPVHDVNPAYFADAAQCNRSGNTLNGKVWTLVIGKRSAETDITGLRRYSRALAAMETYYYRISAGADVVTGSFQTQNIPLGTTRKDPIFDRTKPGEYNYPSIDWNEANTKYVDPHTGLQIERITGVGSPNRGQFQPRVYGGQSFSSLSSNSNEWTINGGVASYFGSGAGKLFLQALPPAEASLNQYIGLDSAQLRVTLSGTAGTVDVCLSNDGVSCAGKTISQSISTTASVLTFGSTAAGLDDWRNTTRVPSNMLDLITRSGTVQKNGTSLQWQGGGLFSTRWSPGSVIRVNGAACTIAELINEKEITLANTECTADGTWSYTANTWGFLLQAAGSASGSISLQNASYQITTSGSLPGIGSSGASRRCSNVRVRDANNVGGWLCEIGNPVERYGMAGAIVFFGDDGSARLLGGMQATPDSRYGNGSCTTSEGAVWDSTVAGKFYCLGSNTAGKPVIFSIRYTGNYVAQNQGLEQPISPAVATLESADLEAEVMSFTAGYERPFQPSHCSTWRMRFQTAGELAIFCLLTFQDTPGWLIAHRQGSGMVGAVSTWTGAPGKANRWGALHSFGVAGDDGWIYSTVNPLTYRSLITSGTLTSSMTACPINAVQPEIQGQVNCSTVTLNSITPIDPDTNQSLFGMTIGVGDWASVTAGTGYSNDAEIVRILTINNNTVTLLRGQKPFAIGANLNHSGQIGLRMYPTGFSELWWNYKDDPQGIGIGIGTRSTLLADPDSFNCHQVFENDSFLMSCRQNVYRDGATFRTGAMPWNFDGRIFVVNWDAGFAGSTYNISTSFNESHPSMSQTLASPFEKGNWFDARPYAGDPSIATADKIQRVTGTLYKMQANPRLEYRQQGLLVLTGNLPLVDISPGPITAGSTDLFKYCYVLLSGDCQAGSSAGEVYFSVPMLTQTSVFPVRFIDWPATELRDISISQNTTSVNQIVQAAHYGEDPDGSTLRRLTSSFTSYKDQNIYWNLRPTPDNSRIFWTTINLDGSKSEPMTAKLPPFPAMESKVRGDYIPLPIQLPGKTGDEVRAVFGYAENGTANSFFCHERQVSCMTSTVPGTFRWVDENENWTACSNGCKVTIPAISGRVLYYRIERRNGTRQYQSPVLIRAIR